MIEIVVTCGATVGFIIQSFHGTTGYRPLFEKLLPGDARGSYGSYLLWLDPADAETVLHRHPTVTRRMDVEA